MTSPRRERLAAARLYLIAPTRVGGRPATEVVAAAIDGGVDIVQLRDKQADDYELVATGVALRPLCDARGALLIVNDRTDVALACAADGVHVGQRDETVASVRAAVGPDLLIGLSTHTPKQIADAEASDADYLGVGPVYATPTKPEREPVGLPLVAHAATTARKPFFAIGGIDATRAPEVVAAGARRIAVVRAICDAPDPCAAASMLRDALDARLTGAAAH